MRGLPILVPSDCKHLRIEYGYDISQSIGSELPDFTPREVNVSDLYFTLINLAGDADIQFIEIQDCRDKVTYMIEEIVFSYITRQDSNLDLLELERVTLTELITATVASILKIVYPIPDEFAYCEMFSEGLLSGSFHIFLECTRNIINEIDNVIFI